MCVFGMSQAVGLSMVRERTEVKSIDEVSFGYSPRTGTVLGDSAGGNKRRFVATFVVADRRQGERTGTSV